MKVLRKIGLGFTFALVSLGLFSCSSDDDDTPNVEEKVTASYTYTLEVNQDFLNLADVTVSVVAPGESKKETLSSTSYKKNITLESFPASVSAGVTYQWKEGVDAAAADGKKITMKIGYNVSSSKGATGISNKTISHTIDGEQMNELRENDLKVLKSVNKTYKFVKDAEGNVDFEVSNYEF